MIDPAANLAASLDASRIDVARRAALRNHWRRCLPLHRRPALAPPAAAQHVHVLRARRQRHGQLGPAQKLQAHLRLHGFAHLLERRGRNACQQWLSTCSPVARKILNPSQVDPRRRRSARLNAPCCDGSKSTGVCAARFTGAKYARTRRATGAGAENQVAAIYSPCSW